MHRIAYQFVNQFGKQMKLMRNSLGREIIVSLSAVLYYFVVGCLGNWGERIVVIGGREVQALRIDGCVCIPPIGLSPIFHECVS